jgi:feruloyl esterase
LQSLKNIYAGPTDAQGRQIFPAAMPSGEDGDGGWKDWIIGPTFEKSALVAFASGFFQDMVFNDRNWSYHTADIEQSLQAANQKMASALNATDPDLSKLKARGGKLILYHGWLDAAISPVNTIRYYQSVQSKMGEQSTGEFVKLYMVPGMMHCVGGPGPFIFGQLGIAMSRDPQENMFTSLEQWTEQGKTPNRIIATKLRDDKDRSNGILMTRPLCPFPELAVYDGKGDPKDASAFACVISAKPEVLH